jgi:hypothetical protein
LVFFDDTEIEVEGKTLEWGAHPLRGLPRTEPADAVGRPLRRRRHPRLGDAFPERSFRTVNLPANPHPRASRPPLPPPPHPHPEDIRSPQRHPSAPQNQASRCKTHRSLMIEGYLEIFIARLLRFR